MLVSLKCYEKRRLDNAQHQRIRREAELHAKLVHPNILSLYGAFEDERRYYLVHESSHEVISLPFRAPVMPKDFQKLWSSPQTSRALLVISYDTLPFPVLPCSDR